MKFNPKPVKVFEKDGMRYAYFELNNVEDKDIEITVQGIAWLVNLDLKRIKRTGKSDKSDLNILSEFLKKEDNIDTDNFYIKKVAEAIKGDNKVVKTHQ